MELPRSLERNDTGSLSADIASTTSRATTMTYTDLKARWNPLSLSNSSKLTIGVVFLPVNCSSYGKDCQVYKSFNVLSSSPTALGLPLNSTTGRALDDCMLWRRANLPSSGRPSIDGRLSKYRLLLPLNRLFWKVLQQTPTTPPKLDQLQFRCQSRATDAYSREAYL